MLFSVSRCQLIPQQYNRVSSRIRVRASRVSARVNALNALTLLVGQQEGRVKTEWWGAGVVICLEQGADLHMAHLMPLPLALSCFSKVNSIV